MRLRRGDLSDGTSFEKVNFFKDWSRSECEYSFSLPWPLSGILPLYGTLKFFYLSDETGLRRLTSYKAGVGGVQLFLLCPLSFTCWTKVVLRRLEKVEYS